MREEIKVMVTYSNSRLFRPGEVTDVVIDHSSGNRFIRCSSQMKYEDLDWAVDFWGLKFKEIDENGVDTGN